MFFYLMEAKKKKKVKQSVHAMAKITYHFCLFLIKQMFKNFLRQKC